MIGDIKMKIIKDVNLDWHLNEEENVSLGVNHGLLLNRLDIVHARLEPGENLKKHSHERPNGGQEIFFFYKGGNFVLQTDRGTITFDEKESFYLCFDSGESHGIANISGKSLEFQAIYSPPFKEGEVKLSEE